MRVLIVEDDHLLADSLAAGLRAEGYAVEVANDGETGLWFATEESFDAVILDIMLPKRNGFSVVSELRRVGSAVPVLMLTAKDGDYDQAEALDSGADDYLVKPFSYTVLLARLRALIRRGSPGGSAMLALADLRIDTAAHRCWRGDAEVSLTAREFSLLEYFAHRPGVVVTKTELLDRVWDGGAAFGSNVVDVYVGYLRRKLEAAGGASLLHTVRGVGYRLASDPEA